MGDFALIYHLVFKVVLYETNCRMIRGPEGFIHPETLVLNGTTGDNDHAAGTVNQPVLGFLVRRNTLWAAFRS